MNHKTATDETFLSTAKTMFSRGGFRPFFVGTTATLGRDIIFGGTYSYLRFEITEYIITINNRPCNDPTSILLKKYESNISFISNLIAGSLATILSSPLNYFRNIHYATSPDKKPDNFITITKDLIHRTRQENTLWKKLSYLQSRLRIGWGTARVGVGMAVGSEFYTMCTRSTTTNSIC